MVDNRSTSVFGVSGSLNFKSGDISGTAAKTSDEKMGQGTEYFAIEQDDEQNNSHQNQFVDRSAQLTATLSSLAMMNVAGMIKNNKNSKNIGKLKHIMSDEKEKLESLYDEDNSEDY